MVAQARVELSGPLFDGRAVAQVDAFLAEAEERVAEVGVNLVKQRLGQVLQNPTGEYKSRVQTERAREDWAVTDDRSVKGPWLEGVDSRNATTRFKGYHTFRLVTQELDDQAGRIAEQQVLPRYLDRMNS